MMTLRISRITFPLFQKLFGECQIILGNFCFHLDWGPLAIMPRFWNRVSDYLILNSRTTSPDWLLPLLTGGFVQGDQSLVQEWVERVEADSPLKIIFGLGHFFFLVMQLAQVDQGCWEIWVITQCSCQQVSSLVVLFLLQIGATQFIVKNRDNDLADFRAFSYSTMAAGTWFRSLRCPQARPGLFVLFPPMAAKALGMSSSFSGVFSPFS